MTRQVWHAIHYLGSIRKRPLALLFAKGFSISDNGNESSKCDSDISDGNWVNLNGQNHKLAKVTYFQ